MILLCLASSTTPRRRNLLVALAQYTVTHFRSSSTILKFPTTTSTTTTTTTSKNVWFSEQNNYSAHASRFLVYISLTSTARLQLETSQCDVLWRTWTYDDKCTFLYLNMNKTLKNSTLGKVLYISRIERFQIDAIKFERTQIHFLMMFSLLSSSLLLKLPNLSF